MKKAHTIRMNPRLEQVEYRKRACGTRRFVYNWGREHGEAEYQAYKAEQETIPEAERKLKSPTAMALKSQFHALRERDYPWTYDVTRCVVDQAFDESCQGVCQLLCGARRVPAVQEEGQIARVVLSL